MEPLDRFSQNFVCRSPVAVALSSCGGVASGFMDDVTFGCNRPYGRMWRLNHEAITVSGIAIPGRSLMSMNARF